MTPGVIVGVILLFRVVTVLFAVPFGAWSYYSLRRELGSNRQTHGSVLRQTRLTACDEMGDNHPGRQHAREQDAGAAHMRGIDGLDCEFTHGDRAGPAGRPAYRNPRSDSEQPV
jgi:hypothetical protein